MLQQATHILESVFGFAGFRPPQDEVVNHLAGGGDALVLMPTGGGKSLCYQVPALLRAGTAIVISPLIALMQDQVFALQQNGVRAACLHSNLDPQDARAVMEHLHEGDLDLLYVAPERLLNSDLMDRLEHLEVALFAIDEAHCVSQWGHDFRPEYRRLSVLHERFPWVPRIALTATADEQTRAEIIEHLGLAEARLFLSGFDRPNIRYHVIQKNKAREQLLAFLKDRHRGDAGIVYCLSRRKVEDTAQWLSQRGWNALPYHAGLDARIRRDNQQRFINEEGVVMVATIAFGMGIDKPNVRFVAHLDLPKSVESYYQETGRAGRDGLPANAWMTYGLQDVITLRQMLASSEALPERKRMEQQRLEAMLGFSEITGCRRRALLGHFGEQSHEDCGNCDNCLTPPKTWDGTDAARKALSCVYRTGQRFGANHVINVLLGKDQERVRSFGHDKLSTFGIGNELNANSWRSVFRQLVAGGYLSVDAEGFGSLQLTEAARPLLRGESSLALRSDTRTEKARERPAHTELAPQDQRLWDALRGERRRLAEEQGVPPYVIFHDTTLLEMVRMRPHSLDRLHGLTGVGERKLARYGREFLAVIWEFEHADEPGAEAAYQFAGGGTTS